MVKDIAIDAEGLGFDHRASQAVRSVVFLRSFMLRR